eukprot:maker-scaffold_51-snap-gene-1.67-mRNA-1 protein AED:0.05 eAED:0.05 QI:119/1/1/1/1/1/4/95/192
MAEASHPLENTWVFWEHTKGEHSVHTEASYGSSMHKLGEFATVEEFWRYKNILPLPSQIFSVTNGKRKKLVDREVEGYSLFKKGIRPAWEDPMNKDGADLWSRKTVKPEEIDNLYEDMLLCLIGETIDPDDQICGIRLVDKSRHGRAIYKLELWYKTDNQEVRQALQENILKVVGSGPGGRPIFDKSKSHTG